MEVGKTLPQQEPKPAAAGEHPEIHDRVLEAYLGNLGDQFRLDTQKRIHWVCSKVKGPRVLDVGCSQGIAPVLLGREGCQVTGIDTDPQAIAAAEAFLASQSASVQKNITFLNADFITHPFDREIYDTVILSEVLEHLVNPATFVELAAERLEAGGRLVITVPFGINDWIDHKRTYYATEPLRLIWKRFSVDDVELLGKWIGFSCSKRQVELQDELTDWPWSLIERVETAFYGIERFLLTKSITLGKQVEDTNKKNRAANEQVAKLKSQLEALPQLEKSLVAKESQIKAAEEALATMRAEVVENRAKLDEAILNYRVAIEQMALLKERIAQADTELAKSRQEVQAEQARRHAGEVELAKLQEKLLHQQTQSTELRTILDEANLKQRNLTKQMAALREQIAQADTELVKSRQDVQAEQARRHANEVELTKLQEQLSHQQTQSTELRTILDEANLKHRDLIGQVALLREQIAQADTELARSRQEVQAEQARRHTNEDELTKLQEQLSHQQTQSTELRTILDEANLKHRDLIGQVALLREQIAQADTELARSRQEVQAEQARCHTGEDELTKLQEKLTDQQTQSTELRAVLDEAHHNHRDLTGQVALLREQAAQDEAELDHVRTELGSEQTQRIAGELELFRHQEKSRHQQALAETALQAREQRITTLQEALKRSRSDIEASISQPAEKQVILAEELAALQRQLETVRAEQAATQQQLAKAKQLTATTPETETLRQSLAAAQTEQQTAQAALIKTSSELEIAQALRRDEQHRLKLMTDRADLLEKAANAPQAPTTEVRFSPKKGKKEKQTGKQIAAVPAVSAAAGASVQSTTPSFVASLKGLKVACIMDEFTYSSYRPECNLLRLTPQHWQDELEAFTPDLLFIESAWRGKDDLWTTKISNRRPELVDIVEWCRNRQVPTIFWNKEDPVHFETFLKTAKIFDFIFTTDIDCINRYKGALGHDRVYLLPFACQPQTTNPLETYERKDAFCFAGSYYAKYPERTRDLGNFVAALADYKPIVIYDRNYGKNIEAFLFPPEYQPFIVGNLPYDQIDKAYKGYRYSINLNSIKQSQSMFARRVFDLLASNTITISNFSRGVRLLFGDLVVTTDNGHEVLRRLRSLAGDERDERKFRLAGLRKVMLEHTYQDRLAYIASKVQGCTVPSLLPRIVVTAYAQDQKQIDTLLEHFDRQAYVDKRLLIVVENNFKPKSIPAEQRVQIQSISANEHLKLADCLERDEYVAGMVPDDYYGPNYLVDLALATRYSSAQVFGKITQHVWSAAAGLRLDAAGSQYQRASSAAARASLVKADLVEMEPLREWVTNLHVRRFEAANVLAIDEFNYCKDGYTPDFLSTQLAAVNDLSGLESGITINALITQSENIAPAPMGGEEVIRDNCPVLSSEVISQLFPPPPAITYEQNGNALRVTSTLGANKHVYGYATKLFSLAELDFRDQIKFYLDTSNELNIQVAVIFYNAQKERISHVIRTANVNQIVAIPENSAWIKLGLRFFESGVVSIYEFLFGHLHRNPPEFIQKVPQLILTERYPDYDDLYNYSFVHTRTMAYNARGAQTDVFQLIQEVPVSYREFQDVDVITGNQQTLDKLLSGGNVKKVLVHMLNDTMWKVLQHHVDRTMVYVWVHGSEILPWYRRDFNYDTEQQRDTAKIKSEARMVFWRALLKEMPANLKLIFVSKFIAEVVMEDVGIRLPEERYTVIHNAIDTELFAYCEKTPELRKKILSIRPYASRTYANDLSVRAILDLSQKPWFNDLEFRMIGDGALFDETLAPLREFSNVQIERRFLTRAEISILHREYGVFLCPSRWDSHGVSRDEAMSSGLVPITNRIAAIPEFVDEHCGLLVEPEDAAGLAQAIERLYDEPDLFLDLSRNAAARVRRQCDFEHTIQREIVLIACGDGAA